MSKLYSILMYNFNDYEVMREPEELDPECEYIYVTDNRSLESTKWNIIVDDSLDGLSAFDKCYRVRFNLFKYVSSPVCIYIDGSIQIHKSIGRLYNAFMQSNSDIGLNIHPSRTTMLEEYPVWVQSRGYSPIQMAKCFAMFAAAGYDLNYRGLYQGTMRICRNTELNSKIDQMVFALLRKLGSNNVIERLDQTIYSFVINKYFYNLKVFPFSQQVFQSKYMTWMVHNTNNPWPYNLGAYMQQGYVFNNLTPLYLID